jgi:hypothetical protein
MNFENVKELLVVDPLQEKGHVKFNGLFLKKLSISNNQVMTPCRISLFLSKKRGVRMIYSLQQFLYLLYILFYSLSVKKKKYCLYLMN